MADFKISQEISHFVLILKIIEALFASQRKFPQLGI
jgi:hypothetical protein